MFKSQCPCFDWRLKSVCLMMMLHDVTFTDGHMTQPNSFKKKNFCKNMLQLGIHSVVILKFCSFIMFGARAIKRRRAKEEELKVHLAGEQSFCRGQHFKSIFIFSIQALRANGPPPVFERSGPSAVK